MSLIQCIIKIKEGLRQKQVDGKGVKKIQGDSEVPQSAQTAQKCPKFQKVPDIAQYCLLLPQIALCLLRIRDCLREKQVDGYVSQCPSAQNYTKCPKVQR